MNLKSLVVDHAKDFIRNRQNRIFVIFLFFSFLSWLMIKLSNDYEARVNFHVTYENIPKNIEFLTPPSTEVSAVIRTRGTQIFKYKLFSQSVRIDFSKVKKRKKKIYMNSSIYQDEIRKSLDYGGDIILKSIIPDTLFFNLDTLRMKKVKIKPLLHLELKKGFQVDSIDVTPSEVEVRSSENILDTLQFIRTSIISKKEVQSSFSEKVTLPSIPKIFFKLEEVLVHCSIYKIAEEIFNIPIDVIHVPSGTSIKIFPKEIPILCKGPLKSIKAIQPRSVRVVFDYNKYMEKKDSYTPEIETYPSNIEVKSLLSTRIDVLIRR